MIQSWRKNFAVPSPGFFGFIELSTWCVPGNPIPLLRDAQMAALALGGVGYGVNADHGAGCNVHPPPKQYCAKRLANSALEISYGKNLGGWQSPTYKSATATSTGSVTIALNDVSAAGLVLAPSANAGTVNCTASVGSCTWATITFDVGGSVNATVAVTSDGQGLVLSATPPTGATKAIATSYAYGAVPFMTAYRSDADLPVRQWSQSI
jgi:hypothetical protein